MVATDVLDAMPWLVSTVHTLDSAHGDWGAAIAEKRKAKQKKQAKRKQTPSLLNALIQ